jgi:D-glycero-alpha-D-manno-heptose-7-phosphate kinase
MHQLTNEAIDCLCSNGAGVENFGRLLHESWLVKRSLTSKITTSAIDEIYQTGRSAGAIGGKLLGAGGGGFILFVVKPQMQAALREKLKNLIYVPFKFEEQGTQIIYYRPNNNF